MTTTRPGACTAPESSCSAVALQPRRRPWEPPARPGRPGPRVTRSKIRQVEALPWKKDSLQLSLPPEKDPLGCASGRMRTRVGTGGLWRRRAPPSVLRGAAAERLMGELGQKPCSSGCASRKTRMRRAAAHDPPIQLWRWGWRTLCSSCRQGQAAWWRTSPSCRSRHIEDVQDGWSSTTSSSR